MERIYIRYNDEPEVSTSGSVLQGLRSLSSKSAPPAPAKKPVVEPDESPFLLSSHTKKKDKEKKGKKGKKKKSSILDMELMSGGNVVNNDEEDPENPTPTNELAMIDIDAILNGEDTDDIGGDIINEGRRGYERLKKEENPYKKEFAEELTLLFDLLDDINRFGKDVEKKYKATEASRARGASKYVNDLIISIQSNKTSKLAVIKEIASIKKSIVDLKIKADDKANKANTGATASVQHTSAAFLQNILKKGRHNFIKESQSSQMSDSDDDIDDLIADIRKQDEGGYTSGQMDHIQQMIESRLDNEDNLMRSSNGSRYIEYENRNVKIQIHREVDTGNWRFVAIDQDNQEVQGFPLPTRASSGKIRFSEDGRSAVDELGRSYRVMETFSPSAL